MSIKLRYTLLFVGCIIYTEFLALTLAHDFWNDALYHILWPGAFYSVWWLLVLIWPAWIFVFCKYGWRGETGQRVLSVVVPVIASLIIMRWVLGYILYGLAVNFGGLH